MPSSAAQGWEVVRVGPPGTPAGESAPWVEFVIWRDERVALPRRWDAEVRHPDVPWNVVLTVAVESGRVECERVAVSRRPGGPRVTSAALRLPVDTLAVASAWKVWQWQDPAEDDPAVLFARMRAGPPGFEAEDVARQPKAIRARLQIREPGGDYSDPPVSAAALKVMRDLARPEQRPRANDKDALLRDVVRIYRQALAGHDPKPRKAVAAELNYEPTYVGKLLVEARKRGMLGPAHVGRAGERSTPAVTVDHDKKARKR